MPIATLKFNLPEEASEFETAVKAHDWKYTVWDFNQWLREQLKYHEASDDYQIVRDKLWEFLNDRNLNFDE